MTLEKTATTADLKYMPKTASNGQYVHDACICKQFPICNSYNIPFIKILTRLSARIKFLHKFFRLCLLPETTQFNNELADNAIVLYQQTVIYIAN